MSKRPCNVKHNLRFVLSLTESCLLEGEASDRAFTIIGWLNCSCNDFQLNTYLNFIVFLIDLEGGAVVAVGYTVTFNPLMRVISSLGLYSCHLGFLTKIHLQPLMTVISCGNPWATPGIQSGMVGLVWRLVLTGSCDLCIAYASLLHPEWVWTCYTQTIKEKKGKSQTLQLMEIMRKVVRWWEYSGLPSLFQAPR